jgi:LPXTG-motif cell wall-anchored protein
MKNIKKLMALVIAVVMVIGTMSLGAMADTVGQLSVNSTLSVSGLDAGDKVTVYKVLTWDENSSTGWVYGDGVSSPATPLTTIVTSENGKNTISAAIASDLASHLGTQYGATDTVSGTSWTRENVESGLYMIIVEPATMGTVYNPIFVAANYYGGGTSDPADSANAIAISENQASYNDSAMAKKTTIKLDKEAKGKDKEDGITNNTLADGAYTTDVGEEIDFSVTTHVPMYGTNYTAPKFIVEDVLTGLALTGANVKVYKNDGGTKGAELTGVFTITGNAADSTTYTISFNQDYLQGTNTTGEKIPATGQDILIEYTAKVTDAAEKIVNQDNNTVTLKFSTKPDDTTGAGRFRDETNHFTFSIDANLLGHNDINESSTEAIKVGVDSEGNYIVESSHYAWSDEWHGPLEGAQFKLYTDSGCTNPYTNTLYPSGVTVNSDSTGRINIKGLDAGTYYLKEITAPTGYIKMQEAVEVVITADIEEEYTYTKDVDGTDVTIKTNKLNGYTVKIGGSTTTYTITLEESSANAQVADRVQESSDDSELKNTKGVELPSTGGMGTTLFYVIGAILVLGAGIILVSKRRMSAN